jgi:hypothetical protein
MDIVAEIGELEERLRQAMLTSNAADLTILLSDTLVFTNQDGVRLTKDDDIAAHASGQLSVNGIDMVGERIVRPMGEAVCVCVIVDLDGSYAGQPFQGRFAYTRLWHRKPAGWQVEIAHCSQLAPAI